MIDDDDNNWPTSGKQFALPQRDNTDFGKSQERRMSLVGLGNYGAIRTVEWQEPDGSVSRLRTRGGWPVFEIDEAQQEEVVVMPRGFVAKVPNGRAILFDPYTLTILQTPYLPAVNEYTVQDIATSWNVPNTDTTKWNDTFLFDGQTIKVNNLAMSSLLITADHGYLAVPYTINRDDNSDQYGNSVRNETEKRVFAIGRDKATSWGGSGVTAILEPEEPRTATVRTSMTIGQRLDFSNDSAQIGQFYFPETASSWDSETTEWYFTSANVQMLIAANYLVKTQGSANVVMSAPAFASLGSVSGTRDESVNYGSTDIGGKGPPYHISPSSYAGGGAEGIIRWGMDSTIKGSITGFLRIGYSGNHWGGSIAENESVAGVPIEYSGSHDYRIDDRSQVYGYGAQYLSFNVGNTTNYTWLLNAYYDEFLFWGIAPGGSDPSSTSSARGEPGRQLLGANFTNPFPGSGTTQHGQFEVTAGGRQIIYISYYIDEYSGEGKTWEPNLDYYPPNFAQDIWSETGYGATAEARYGNYNDGNSSPVTNYKQVNGTQSPEVIAEIEAQWDLAREALLAQTHYNSEAADGITDRPFGNAMFYHFTSVPSVTKITKTLSWETRDFILHDATNGVYIEVIGTYSGSSAEQGNNGSATITIHVKIETRYDTNTILLKTYEFGSVGFPDPVEISTGVYAIPAPKVRGIFAPLHQEQGSFKGGHYVELSEEANGALPAHLFNFILRLLPYDNIGFANQWNEEQTIVYFIPCNLLEMLYAVVFSHEFGVSQSARYPVTFADRFTDIMSTLFNDRFRIAVRDGIEVAWTDGFGADFSSDAEITLHRT